MINFDIEDTYYLLMSYLSVYHIFYYTPLRIRKLMDIVREMIWVYYKTDYKNDPVVDELSYGISLVKL